MTDHLAPTDDPDFQKFLENLHASGGELLIHKETGSVDTREGWLASYDPEELAERNLTAEEALISDLFRTLFPIEESTLDAINEEYRKHFDSLEDALEFLNKTTKVFGVTENTIVHVYP